MSAATRPAVALESPLPDRLPAGSATALYLQGTAWDGDRPVTGLSVLVAGERHPVRDVAMPRFDVPHRRSGFWVVVPVRMPADGGPVALHAEVSRRDGPVVCLPLGTIDGDAAVTPARADPGPRIAVCLATFEPDEALFRAQLDSLRAQTDTDWTCVISDDFSGADAYARIERLVGGDARFTLSRAPERIGFYRNFERALTLAPDSAGLIALCDQDDVWHPDKLATLRAALGSAPLVYSDLRLVDAGGRVLRETLWAGRSNNRTSMGSMLIANSITGAATLMRREVAERALPFPDSPGIEFHDHWIALVALSLGAPAYVGRPLYDYVQHSGAILGRVSGGLPPSPAPCGAPTRGPLRVPRPRLRGWRAAYFLGWIPAEIRARTLLLRFGETMEPDRRRALERFLAAERSSRALARFALRPARMLLGRTETRGTEWELAVGAVWRRLAVAVARLPRWPEHLLLDSRFPDPPHFEQRRLRRWRESV